MAKEFDKNKLCRWQIFVFFTKNCKNSKNSETTSIKSPINLSANCLPFVEAKRLFFWLEYLILCMLYELWSFEWLIAFDKIFFNQIQNGSLSKIRYVPTAFICMCSRLFKSGISRKETYSGKTIDIFLSFMYISFV